METSLHRRGSGWNGEEFTVAGDRSAAASIVIESETAVQARSRVVQPQLTSGRENIGIR